MSSLELRPMFLVNSAKVVLTLVWKVCACVSQVSHLLYNIRVSLPKSG